MPTEKIVTLRGNDKDTWQFVYSESAEPIFRKFDRALDAMDAGLPVTATQQIQEIACEHPDFIDAYAHLGLFLMEEGEYKKAYIILDKGLANIQPILPKNFFAICPQLIWGILDNRPFLRCYANLGHCYLALNRMDLARDIFENLIMMNPNDNQGIRNLLIGCYFSKNEISTVLDLCNKYPKDILPATMYGKVLCLYQLGEIKAAEEQLRIAMGFAPKVAQELVRATHKKPKNCDKYPGIVIGSEEEAYEYWLTHGKYWKNAKGAINFLKQYL